MADDKTKIPERDAIEARHPGLVALLTTERDAAIARRYGLSRERVRQYRDALGIPRADERGWEKALPLLGKQPDAEVARLTGISVKRIARARRERNIEPAGVPAEQAAVIAEHRAELGTMSDYAFGEKHGISSSYVQTERQKLGIPAFKPRKRKQAAS